MCKTKSLLREEADIATLNVRGCHFRGHRTPLSLKSMGKFKSPMATICGILVSTPPPASNSGAAWIWSLLHHMNHDIHSLMPIANH